MNNSKRDALQTPDADSISLTLEEYEKHFIPNLPEEFVGDVGHQTTSNSICSTSL